MDRWGPEVGSGRNWRAHHDVCVPLISGHTKKLDFWLCKVYRAMWPNSTQASKNRKDLCHCLFQVDESRAYSLYSLYFPEYSLFPCSCTCIQRKIRHSMMVRPFEERNLALFMTVWSKILANPHWTWTQVRNTFYMSHKKFRGCLV